MTDAQAGGVGAKETPSILTKAFDVLYAFNQNERVMTMSQLARASGLPKSTVHRLLARLVELGAIEHHRSGYKLGLGLMQLGATTPAAKMRDQAIPYLVALQRWSRQTVTFAVLREFDVVYLEKLAPADSPSTRVSIGARLPSNCTAIGKALLSYEDLDDLADFLPLRLHQMTPHSITDADDLIEHLRVVRREGIAREHNEAQMGLEGVAAPVVVNGFAVGAIAINYGPNAPASGRVDAALRDTTAQLSAHLRSYVVGAPEHELLVPRTLSDPPPWG
ncbi:IclR family transcriptional regulator [Gordonia polyisoprenivorans]|uniref:IclR family transcriptional regulator n=1 Tax=Gordonia polyisoprenivorans TaxID=84595 RepID=UPI001FCBBDF4|nr:IclR family transcriptional regulator [Gordonia polyisoprenivorans]